MTDQSINEQSVWRYIRERSDMDPARRNADAVIDCTRTYTYAQMFVEWERYARAFSALGMTGANRARVAIGGTISAEPLFAFYGLNMTGAEVSMFSYPDFLPGGQWKTMAEKEHITDLILSDIMITPDTWPEIRQVKESLGIRNVVLVHSRLGGPCTGPAELIYNEMNYRALKQLEDMVFLDDLLRQYPSEQIVYGSDDPDRIAVITHTSGTTMGTRKPLPFTQRAVNTVATDFGQGFHGGNGAEDAGRQLRLAPSFDFSSFLCMCGVINADLAAGETVVLTFFGFMHPKFIRAVSYYKLDVLFTSGFMIDSWMKRRDIEHEDFSSLRVFSCGGSYISPEKLRQYTAFLKKHGYDRGIYRGYGMSEAGGVSLDVPPGCCDDILGFPSVKENFLVRDEEDGQYYTSEDGVRTGVLYIASDSLCRNVLDGQELFSFTQIGGRDFICTNDLVRVNENGSFSYAGRADRYFVNNEGVRFEAGIVETCMAKQPCVRQCAIVPVLDKRIHDTVPVLYAVPEEDGPGAAETLRGALVQVFLADGLIERSNLPSQMVLVEEIPCNSNGKTDIYRITRERLKGVAYQILPVTEGGKTIDITLDLAEQLDSITGGTLPEGMGTGSALGIFKLFNASADATRSHVNHFPLRRVYR